MTDVAAPLGTDHGAPPEPPPARSRRARLSGPLLAGGAVAAATLALHLRDPHSSGSWGYCPTALVGLSCPACGSLRAVNDLTHLDLAAAASSNLLLVVAAPLAVAWWLHRAVTLWRGEAPAFPGSVRRAVWIPVAVAVAVVVVAFTVARNLPLGAWLAP